MKYETTTKRILILPILAIFLLAVYTTFLSSPSVESAASTVTSTSTTLLPQIQNVDWDTIPTTTSPPTTVVKKAEVRKAAPRPSRSRAVITSTCGPSSNKYVNPCGCEASSPQSVSASGKYRGKYQFDQQTYEAHGGHGDPAAASEAEQDRVAANVNYDAWPNC